MGGWGAGSLGMKAQFDHNSLATFVTATERGGERERKIPITASKAALSAVVLDMQQMRGSGQKCKSRMTAVCVMMMIMVLV